MHLYLFEITAVLYNMTLFSHFTCVQHVGGTVKFILQSIFMFFSLYLSDLNSEVSLHTQLTSVSGFEYASLVTIYLFLSSLCNMLLLKMLSLHVMMFPVQLLQTVTVSVVIMTLFV